MSNCTVGLFLGTKLAQFPLRPRWRQQKKRSLNSVPELAASPPSPPAPQNNLIVQQETTPTSLPFELKMANFSFLGTIQYAYFWLSPSGKQRQILALGPNLCNRIWVHATSGLWKMPLSICQSGWREIPLILESVWGPEQGLGLCRADVTNQNKITSATQACL